MSQQDTVEASPYNLKGVPKLLGWANWLPDWPVTSLHDLPSLADNILSSLLKQRAGLIFSWNLWDLTDICQWSTGLCGMLWISSVCFGSLSGQQVTCVFMAMQSVESSFSLAHLYCRAIATFSSRVSARYAACIKKQFSSCTVSFGVSIQSECPFKTTKVQRHHCVVGTILAFLSLSRFWRQERQWSRTRWPRPLPPTTSAAPPTC